MCAIIYREQREITKAQWASCIAYKASSLSFSYLPLLERHLVDQWWTDHRSYNHSDSPFEELCSFCGTDLTECFWAHDNYVCKTRQITFWSFPSIVKSSNNPIIEQTRQVGLLYAYIQPSMPACYLSLNLTPVRFKKKGTGCHWHEHTLQHHDISFILGRTNRTRHWRFERLKKNF